MSDIHNTQQRLESAVKNLEQSNYSKEELQALKDFKLQLESEGLESANLRTAIKEGRTVKYINSKEAAKTINVVSDMGRTRKAFSGGKQQSSLDDLDKYFT